MKTNRSKYILSNDGEVQALIYRLDVDGELYRWSNGHGTVHPGWTKTSLRFQDIFCPIQVSWRQAHTRACENGISQEQFHLEQVR
jgi:hypothetical protein